MAIERTSTVGESNSPKENSTCCRYSPEHAGVVLSRAQLLRLVWGYDFAADTNVVDVFVTYLRKKLEVDGAPRVIHTVRGVGFVLRAER